MVQKHKETINKKLISGFEEFIEHDNSHFNNYLFVHIRRNDFLEVDEFKDLNYEDKVWIKSIKNLYCKKIFQKL